MQGYSHFSLWNPIALAEIHFIPCGPNLVQEPLHFSRQRP